MPTRPEGRSRGWCWTINNPTFDDLLSVEELKNHVNYYVYGNERGTDRETPHWQGFLYCDTKLSFSRVKQLLPRAHVEPQRGSTNQAIEYCKKEGDWTEWGSPPDHGGGRTQRDKWRRLIELSKLGEWERIELEFPGEWIRYGGRLRSLRVRTTTPIDGDLEHEWWYGPTGTGKSRQLWTQYPEHYAKEINKWWDGYQDQDVVAIEEWAPCFEMLASKLKIWADRYPFNAEVKGGTLLRIRPKKLIVLSNYKIEECFPNPADHLPLKRRFKVVHFPLMFTNPTALQNVQDWIDEIDTVESLLSLSQ